LLQGSGFLFRGFDQDVIAAGLEMPAPVAAMAERVLASKTFEIL
jgi:hypothetical protein